MSREAARRPLARGLALVMSLFLLAAAPMLGPGSRAFAASVALTADGSSWAQPAIDQWRQDISPQGIQISFTGNGSATGRQSWANGADDFTASDVPFRSAQDQGVGQAGQANYQGGKEDPKYGYSYIPITAGGTTFMYNLTVGGKQVRDLRLSTQTVVDIFTNKITNWNDQRITSDYGKQLPSKPITPVVRSDGSGATAQFTRWMEHTHKDQWDAYCRSVNGVPCGDYTEFYPRSGDKMTALNGSDIVAGYIKAPTGDGTIGYDEYAFAKLSNWPVVKVLNPAGYYSLPTASNVAIALTAARIRGVDDQTPSTDPNYLQQNLDGVYTNNDPRSYPISSYSYLIVPRAGAALPPPGRFTNEKGAALTKFISYVLCEGQAEADGLGYSPIPRNLVKGGLLQTKSIPGNASPVDPATLSNCNNPTFNSAGELTILKNAPQPNPCDQVGQPLECVVGADGKPQKKGGSDNGGGAAGGAGGKGGGGAAGGTGAGGAGGAARDPNAPGAAVAADPNAPLDGSEEIDPQTGQVVARGRGGSTEVAANVVEVSGRPEDWTLSTLTALELLAVVLVPPLLGRRLLRKRRGSGGAA